MNDVFGRVGGRSGSIPEIRVDLLIAPGKETDIVELWVGQAQGDFRRVEDQQAVGAPAGPVLGETP